MVLRLIAAVALFSGSLLAVEACAITRIAELIVVAKLNSPALPAGRETFPIAGRLNIARILKGAWPETNPVEYDYICSHCRKMTEKEAWRSSQFLTSRYGLWFLVKDGGKWTSADPQAHDGAPGYRPIEFLERYNNCLQGRPFSGRH